MTQLFRTRASIAVMLACADWAVSASPALAQARPDAGSTQRDLEQLPLEAPRARPPFSTEPVRPALRVDEATRFAVSALTVSGNRAFDSATLLALARDDLIGKNVTLKPLQEAAAKITAFYRARGFLVARAYIPAQQIAASGATIEMRSRCSKARWAM